LTPNIIITTYNTPPPPGEFFEITLPEEKRSTGDIAIEEQHCVFQRPEDSGGKGVDAQSMVFSDIDFLPLFRQLQIEGVLTLLEALLGECRIIFVSNDLALLSSCSQAAVGMLYPFVWPHIFVPVLSKKVLEIVMAPMPFIVGIMQQHIPELKKQKLPMENIVMVNLDEGKITNLENCTPNPLPGRHRMTLHDDITACLTRSKTMSSFDNRGIANSFLNFFFLLIGTYRRFMVNDDGPGRELVFSHEKFRASRSGEVKRFLTQFEQNCQMYQQWQDERGSVVAITDERTLTKFEKATLSLHKQFLKQDAADIAMSKLNTAQSHMMYAYRWAASAVEKEMGVADGKAEAQSKVDTNLGLSFWDVVDVDVVQCNQTPVTPVTEAVQCAPMTSPESLTPMRQVTAPFALIPDEELVKTLLEATAMSRHDVENALVEANNDPQVAMSRLMPSPEASTHVATPSRQDLIKDIMKITNSPQPLVTQALEASNYNPDAAIAELLSPPSSGGNSAAAAAEDTSFLSNADLVFTGGVSGETPKGNMSADPLNMSNDELDLLLGIDGPAPSAEGTIQTGGPVLDGVIEPAVGVADGIPVADVFSNTEESDTLSPTSTQTSADI